MRLFPSHLQSLEFTAEGGICAPVGYDGDETSGKAPVEAPGRLKSDPVASKQKYSPSKARHLIAPAA